jgi:sugar lactone lactonase YvrE
MRGTPRRRARSAPATSTASTRASGRATIVVLDFVQPNGLAFSPDESLFYIVDTGLTHLRIDRAASCAAIQGVRRRDVNSCW